MWWSDGGWSWWAWCVMGGAMLVFWVLVAWVIVTLMRSNRSDAPAAYRPEDILADRYARGEIDHDEYQRRHETLMTRGRYKALRTFRRSERDGSFAPISGVTPVTCSLHDEYRIAPLTRRPPRHGPRRDGALTQSCERRSSSSDRVCSAPSSSCSSFRTTSPILRHAPNRSGTVLERVRSRSPRASIVTATT